MAALSNDFSGWRKLSATIIGTADLRADMGLTPTWLDIEQTAGRGPWPGILTPIGDPDDTASTCEGPLRRVPDLLPTDVMAIDTLRT